MRQLGGVVADTDKNLIKEVGDALKRARFSAVTAADVSGTSDFLQKIIDLIRGTGFAVAIFSDQTPAKALANVFFEVGIASILGKPVQLVMTGDNPAPSDFVRTEWIAFKVGNTARLKRDLDRSFGNIERLGSYYKRIGELALDGLEADLELAFERFRQAILITDDPIARRQLTELKKGLGRQGTYSGSRDMVSHHKRLASAVSSFLKLLPDAERRRS